MDITLKHLHTEIDRHGRVRYYVRKRGSRRIRLREEPNTDEFVDEYKRALVKLELIKQAPPGAQDRRRDVRVGGRALIVIRRSSRRSSAFDGPHAQPDLFGALS